MRRRVHGKGGRRFRAKEIAGHQCRVHPPVSEHLVQGRACRWIRLKHTSDEVPAVCQRTWQTKFQDAEPSAER
jgi:hypothetical protein